MFSPFEPVKSMAGARKVIATWRTSCPRLTIWEDAVDRGFVEREIIAGFGMIVTVTEDGEKLLRAHGRVC